MSYCKKMDAALVSKMNRRRPKTMDKLERIWYEGYDESRSYRYHDSRYHFLNLHSFFHGNGTVELADSTANFTPGKYAFIPS